MSASYDLAAFRSSLTGALRDIGKIDGHASPESASNIDPLMHELEVSSTAASFFERRRKEALANLLGAVDTSELDEVVTRVAENEIGEEVHVADGDVYQLCCTVSKPSRRLDEKALRNKLMREHGFTYDQVNKLMSDCSKASNPARRFRIVARG